MNCEVCTTDGVSFTRKTEIGTMIGFCSRECARTFYISDFIASNIVTGYIQQNDAIREVRDEIHSLAEDLSLKLIDLGASSE